LITHNEAQRVEFHQASLLHLQDNNDSFLSEDFVVSSNQSPGYNHASIANPRTVWFWKYVHAFDFKMN